MKETRFQLGFGNVNVMDALIITKLSSEMSTAAITRQRANNKPKPQTPGESQTSFPRKKHSEKKQRMSDEKNKLTNEDEVSLSKCRPPSKG